MQIHARDLLNAWGKLLRGGTPLLSIDVTRECPLHCPGCYARFGDHARAAAPGREPRGDQLASRVLALVARHNPLHVSLVGGEPLLRRRELDVLLPQLSRGGVAAMVVTSGVLPIPAAWNDIPRAVISVSVDGLPADHDRRRAPATYDRILRNIAGRRVNVHWTVVRAAAAREGYFEEYLDFWSGVPEVQHIMISAYTPQRSEHAPEILTAEDRHALARRLPSLRRRYPKLLMSDEIAAAFLDPPPAPDRCLFARMSRAYASDLVTEVSPCVIGGDPDCLQCGCAIAIALHGIAATRLRGPLRVGHLIAVTTSIAQAVNRGRRNGAMGSHPSRYDPATQDWP
ncbi:MAG TPA: radical SAM protein [Vicinamibacterales bacterium]|nr:radical SAM protein [Vicinamibacterales bacterium]